MSLSIQITNGIISLKEGDTLTSVEMKLVKGNGVAYDLTGKTATVIIANKYGKILEKPAEILPTVGDISFKVDIGEITGHGQMRLEVHVLDGEDTMIFPSSDYLVLNIDANLNIIGQTITSLTFDKLKNELENELGFEITSVQERVDGIVNEITTELSTDIIDSAKINWLSPVDTFLDLEGTYPTPQEGEAAQTLDDNKTYRYDGSNWKFIQQFGSGPFSDVYKKLGEQKYYVSVKDFGAKGDGVTDDTQSFINAFASFTGVGSLFIPKGTYKITQSLATDKRIDLIGDGKDVTILNFTNSDGLDCLRFAKTADPGITRLSIKGLSVIGNANTRDGINLGYLTDSMIHDVLVSSCGRDGIHMEKGWIVDVANLTVRENKRHGFYVASINSAYSEVNAITVRKMNSLRNEKIGIVVGDESLTYSENTG
ncbi:glycoside hydrolase family 55 protein, partial [Staphylococcus aureus]|uniref:glycoside hydrolase family 55 protein n=1 Tax=Staphylococcus aureus TaxID=1280 RepID=UPI0020C04F29